MHDFGLIQSASELIGKRAWQEYFKLAGLTCNKAIDIHELKRNQVIAQNSIEKKSHDFTRKEKFFSVLNPFQQIREMNYRARLKLFHQHDGSYLEHYIFVWQS
jgi:hypothetical protein